MSDSHAGEKHGAIVLAAGAGTRMGSVKQLLPWKNSTLLQHTIEQLSLSEIDQAVVVLGANVQLIRQQTDFRRFDVVVNDNWMEGMGTSVVCGLKQLLKNEPDIRSALILLIDQPLLDSKYYNLLKNKYLNTKYKIISSSYFNQMGVPVLFDRFFFDELLRLKGDKGARALLRSHSSQVLSVEVGEKGIDLDTRDKYRHYYELYGSQ